jgi:hypothetical protein
MWLMAKTGFYSIVQKPREKRLTIRARVRNDLIALRQNYLPTLSRILELNVSDYRFRAFASRKDFSHAVAKIAMDIDYPNFKEEVHHHQGWERARVYQQVWATLLGLQENIIRSKE